ncbi:MAG: hypothetical protein JJU40_08350 [Rhodobacteraceae bacterium]|nr:hypothetical protein [Paracoccaceae bacterium]
MPRVGLRDGLARAAAAQELSTMYHGPLLPRGLRPPETLPGRGLHARALRLADAEADHEAVMAPASRLRSRMDPGSPRITLACACPGRDEGWPARRARPPKG